MEGVPVLFIREDYQNNFNKIMASDRTSWIVQGTPGIGKSLFGLWLIYKLIQQYAGSSYSIIHIDVSGDISHLKVENGMHRSYKCDLDTLPSADYVIVDSFAAFSVGSGSSILKKRIFISNDHNPNLDTAISSWNLKADAGTRIYFHPFDVAEAIAFTDPCIGWSASDLTILYDIFGGSARLIASAMGLGDNAAINQPITDMEKLIYDSMKLFFDFDDRDIGGSGLIYKKACLTLSRLFNDSQHHVTVNRALWVLSSSFMHHNANEQPFWASQFMKFLAGAIQSEERANILSELRSIFEQKGYGVLHEYNAHKTIFSNLQRGELYLLRPLNSKDHLDVLKVNISKKRLIRNIDDIKELKDGEYGLPTISNFPLVDAIIKPKYLLQMTISNSHDTKSKYRMRDILKSLGQPTGKMIFILEQKNFNSFKPVTGLGDVNQYKMLADIESTANKLSDLTNKELEFLLEERGLSKSGPKKTLIERLQMEEPRVKRTKY